MTTISTAVSIDINSAIRQVWNALIDPAQIKKYLFGTDTICDWKVGSTIRFTGVWDGKPYEDVGTILAIEPEKLLKYNYWSNFSGKPDILGDRLIITYLLKETEGGTQFTLTQENCPSEEARDHSASNWNMVLNSLKEMLEGNKNE